MALIRAGAEHRRSGATAMNAESSRSHAVLACQVRFARHAMASLPRARLGRALTAAPTHTTAITSEQGISLSKEVSGAVYVPILYVHKQCCCEPRSLCACVLAL